MFGVHLRRVKRDGGDGGEGQIEALTEFISTARIAGLARLAVQIFLTGPTNYQPAFQCNNLDEFDRIIVREDITVLVHGAFVDNPWGRNFGAIRNIGAEMTLCSKMNYAGLVIHLDSRTGANLDWVMRLLASKVPTHIAATVPIFLEVVPISREKAVAAPETSFISVAELTALFQKINQLTGRTHLQFGLCIDTAHLHASGMALAEADAMEDYLSALLPLVKINESAKPLLAFHLNDCSTEYGMGRDKHDNLGGGRVWTGAKSPAWKTVVQFAKKHDLICILETPTEGHAADLLQVSACITEYISPL